MNVYVREIAQSLVPIFAGKNRPRIECLDPLVTVIWRLEKKLDDIDFIGRYRGSRMSQFICPQKVSTYQKRPIKHEIVLLSIFQSEMVPSLRYLKVNFGRLKIWWD
jgi:hypothetical protein